MRGLRAWLLRRGLNRESSRKNSSFTSTNTRTIWWRRACHPSRRNDACIELGGTDRIAERIRDGRPEAWVDHLVRDVRDALRSLGGRRAHRRSRDAHCVGHWRQYHRLFHHSRHFDEPAPGVQTPRLVTLDHRERHPMRQRQQLSKLSGLARQNTTVRPLVAADFERFTLTIPNGSFALRGDLVSTNYFDTLGVRPIAGRTFTGEDDRAQASGLPTVVSERLWQRQFAGAPDVVGRAIALNGHLATIVGVAPPTFAGAVLGESSDIWVPLLPYARVHRTERDVADRSTLRMWIFGRLASGTSLAQARAEFAAISQRLQTAYPETNKGQVVFPIPYSAIATGSLLSRQGNYMLAIFSVITVLTVLIVCANVANLMLARAAARQRELALRQSLGASRTRIIRMLLAEGVLASTVAWTAACAAAITVSRLLARLLPPDPSGATINADFTPDWTVAAYAMTLALLGTVAFTLAPAIRAWRQEVLPWLKAGEHGVVQGRSKLASALVALQLAFSVVLLTGASLAYRSLSVMSGLDLGYKTDHLLLLSMNTAGSAAMPAVNRVLLERLRERLRAIPGVGSVSHARWTSGWSESVRRRGTDDAVRADQNFIGSGYLRLLASPSDRRERSGRRSRVSAPSSTSILRRHSARLAGPDAARRTGAANGGDRRRDAERLAQRLPQGCQPQFHLSVGTAGAWHTGRNDVLHPVRRKSQRRRVRDRTRGARSRRERPDCVHTDDGDGVRERQVAGARDHDAAGDLRGRLAVDRRHRPVRRRHVQHAAPDAGFRPAHGPGGFLVADPGFRTRRRVSHDDGRPVRRVSAQSRGRHGAQRSAVRRQPDGRAHPRRRIRPARRRVRSGVLSASSTGYSNRSDASATAGMKGP